LLAYHRLQFAVLRLDFVQSFFQSVVLLLSATGCFFEGCRFMETAFRAQGVELGVFGIRQGALCLNLVQSVPSGLS
jgi:hypothetical protein